MPVTYNQPKKLVSYQQNAKAQNPAIDSHLESPYIKEKSNQFTNQYQEYPNEINLTKDDINEVQKFVDSHVSQYGKLNDLNLFIPFNKKNYLYRSREICENNLKDNIKYEGKSIEDIRFIPGWFLNNSCIITKLVDPGEEKKDEPEINDWLSSYQFYDFNTEKDDNTEKNEEIGKVIFDKDSINAIILSEYYEHFKSSKYKINKKKSFVIYRNDDGSWIKGKIISNEKYIIIQLNKDGTDNIYFKNGQFYKTISQDDTPSDKIYPKILKFQERNILKSIKKMVIEKLKNDCDCKELQDEIEISQANCKKIVDEKNDTIKNFEGKSFNTNQMQKIREIIRNEIGNLNKKK